MMNHSYTHNVTGDTNLGRIIQVWTIVAQELLITLDRSSRLLPPDIGISRDFCIEGADGSIIRGIVTALKGADRATIFMMPPVLVNTEPSFVNIRLVLDYFETTFTTFKVGGAGGWLTKVWIRPLQTARRI